MKTHARFSQFYPCYSDENLHALSQLSKIQKKSKFLRLWSHRKKSEPVFRSTDSIEMRKKQRLVELTPKEYRYSVPLEYKLDFENFQDVKASNYNLIVYSDLYFKQNKPLNGIIKNLADFNQLENNILVSGYYFEEQDYMTTQNLLRFPHLSIFEVRKTIEYSAILKNLHIQYDFDMNVAAFRAKSFEKAENNACSYKNYVPIITVNDNEAYEEYFGVRNLENVTNRISHARTQRKKFGKIWASNNDLDKITPVKNKDIEKKLNLSSLSAHELEEVLLSRKQNDSESKLKVRSLEDVRLARNFPILEPLLLKEEDELDNVKIRLRISEHKKIVRITIAYTLAFFTLAIITFYIIYYA